MRPAGFVLAALAVVPGVLAKSAVVYFEDKNTPDTYIQKAKDDIIAKGGKITHVYSIIKGFAVEAPDEALQTVQAWGNEHSMRVEEDKVMSIDN